MAIAMTAGVCLVLAALNTGPPEKLFYGQEIAELTSLETGTLYPILLRLFDQGLAHRTRESGDPRTLGRPLRTFYGLTPAGRENVAVALERLHTLAAAVLNLAQRQQS